MTREIIEGIQTIEREKGIESGTLIEALEDALLAAYKKTPGATRHATVELDTYTRRLPRLLDRPALGHRGAPRRGGARADDHRARAAGGGVGRALARARHGRGPDDRPHRRARGRDQARGRDAGRLRPHRRADREAGDPPADPRGGARDDVRGVHRPRERGRHRASSSRQATATTSSSTSARSRRCCRAPSRSTASATSRAAGSRP